MIRRLGKKSEKIRPVVITLNTIGFKIKIQKNKQCLKDTPYYIKEDFPIDVLNKRKELQTQLQKEKEAGNTAYIKYDQLIILNNNNPSRNQPNKRNLSESPESSHHNRQQAVNGSKQPLKKNKTVNMMDYVLQKPKLVHSQTEPSEKHDKTTQLNKA